MFSALDHNDTMLQYVLIQSRGIVSMGYFVPRTFRDKQFQEPCLPLLVDIQGFTLARFTRLRKHYSRTPV